MTGVASVVKTSAGIGDLCRELINVLATSLSTGEEFLTFADHCDLIYKLLESGDSLNSFREAYDIVNWSTIPFDSLVFVNDHFRAPLLERRTQLGKSSLSPRDIAKVIKSEYSNLDLQSNDMWQRWSPYRERDEVSFLKGLTRIAVQDVKEHVSLKKS